MSRRLLSLFSGCGGMDVGFEGGFSCLARSINTDMHADWIVKKHGAFVDLKRTGFETVFANDIRPMAKVAWLRYFNDKPDATYRVESLVDIVKEYRSGNFQFPADIDVVTGGFPCQDFSVAGKRNGFASHRNHLGKLMVDEPSIESRGQLYMWMREVISIVQPKVFVAENVKGLANLNDVKDTIESDFSQAGGGYCVVPARVVHAADYGVPQNRERVIFFGFRRSALTAEALATLTSCDLIDAYDPYPVITHAYTSKQTSPLWPPVVCREAFYGLPEPALSTDLSQQSYSGAKYMGNHCQGQSELDLDRISPTIRSEHHGNIEFRRLGQIHGGTHVDELSQGLVERRLTVRECARIQTFPDSYEFVSKRIGNTPAVSASEAYKLVGNAVPCVLAYHIAMRLASNWELYFGETF